MAGRFRFTPGCCCDTVYHCGDAYGSQTIGPTGNMVAYFNALNAVVGDPRDTAYQKLIQLNAESGTLTTIERSGNYNNDGSLAINFIRTDANFVMGFFQNCSSIEYQINSSSWMVPAWSSFHFDHAAYTETGTLPNGSSYGVGNIEIVGSPIETLDYQSYFSDIDFEDENLLLSVPSIAFVMANRRPGNSTQSILFVDLNWFYEQISPIGDGLYREIYATNCSGTLPAEIYPYGVDTANSVWSCRSTGYLPVEFNQSGTAEVDTTSVIGRLGPTRAITHWESGTNLPLTEDRFNDLSQALMRLGEMTITPYITQYARCDYPMFAFYELKLQQIAKTP